MREYSFLIIRKIIQHGEYNVKNYDLVSFNHNWNS